MAARNSLNEATFDAAVSQCQGNLGLTVFETWATIILDTLFVLISVPRLFFLIRQSTIVRAPTGFLVAKLAISTIFAALNLTLFILTVTQTIHRTECSLAITSLSFISAWFSLAISLLEHFKSSRPSTLLCSYLFLTLLCDIARCQAMWLAVQKADGSLFTSLFTASIVAKVAFITVESLRRRKWVSLEATTHSPEETSSIFSLSLYAWMNELLWRGYHDALTLDDLYPLDKSISSEALIKTVGQLSNSSIKQDHLHILKWVTKPLIGSIAMTVFPRLCLVGFTLCQPFFLQRVLDFISGNQDEAPPGTASGLIGASILIYLGIAVSTSLYWYYQERTQSMLRGLLITAIYQKTTEAKSDTNGDSAAITLMSADVDRIYTGMRYIHEGWANTIQIAVAAWMLQRELGLAFIAPLLVVFFAFACSFTIAKFSVRYQRIWMTHIEKRIGLTSSVLSNVKELRISGLTGPAIDLVQSARVEEIHYGARSRALIAISATVSQVPQTISPVLAFAFGAHVLNATKAFTSLSFLALLTAPLQMFLQTLPIVAACIACFKRICNFLTAPPRSDTRALKSQGEIKEKGSSDANAALIIRNGSFRWADSDLVLRDINISLPYSSITFVIGPVASGKSTLCKVVLGEIPTAQGDVTLNVEKLGFCDQTPFLFNASIRENIIGFSSFDTVRYSEVVRATMLREDLKILPKGDQTRIGSKGVSLSGGQRQRISLARALYHEAELLVLDDIFSGLDGSTQDQICRRVFGKDGLLRRRRTTTLICTQSVQFLEAADHIIALESGGYIGKQGSFQQFRTDERYSQIVKVAAPPNSNDILETATGGSTSTALDFEKEEASHVVDERSTNTEAPRIPPIADLAVYRHYISSIGVRPILLHAVLVVIIGFCSNFTTIWLKFWSDDSTNPNPTHGFSFYIGIYAFIASGALIFVFPTGLIVLRTFVKMSGTRLHETTLNAAMHASIRFLTTTDTGSILNLFSQDMSIIDKDLPRMINNFCITGAIAIGQAVVIAVSSSYLAISYPFFLGLLYLLQKIYLPTSKQLRILDLEAKTPLYTNFLDTLNGLVTIRAFGWFPNQIARNNEMLDTSQRPSYQLAMVQQWLMLTMNVIVAVLAVFLVTLATQLRQVSTSSIGAGMVMLVTFSSVLTGVLNAYTGLEISLGGISRLKFFGEMTEREDKADEDIIPTAEWPSAGKVELKNISANYDEEFQVLSDVDIIIQPREKIAICGRTGSGKSSVLALLLRMLDPLPSSTSKILVDDVPIDRVNRTVLRLRLIAASQDAVFLPDGTTFMANLDPWNVATADETMSVLEAVGLRSAVEEKGGVQEIMSGLSHGEKQLFNLGRIILRRRVRQRMLADAGLEDGGILLLDEITSSVDVKTEKMMKELIEGEFKAYTILMVTHSIEMAIGCDRVIVMEKGRLVEDGDPRSLREEAKSKFRQVFSA